MRNRNRTRTALFAVAAAINAVAFLVTGRPLLGLAAALMTVAAVASARANRTR
jgi:hypothetical protein